MMSTGSYDAQIQGEPAERTPLGQAGTMGLLLDIELPLTVRFGKARLPLREVAKLDAGSVIDLECAGENQVELLVNGRVVATGTAVSVQGKYGVRISGIASPVCDAAPGGRNGVARDRDAE